MGTWWTTRTANNSMIQFDLLSSLDLPISKWRWCYAVSAIFSSLLPLSQAVFRIIMISSLPYAYPFPLLFKQAAPSLSFYLSTDQPTRKLINREPRRIDARENRRKERNQEYDYCVPVLAYFTSLSLCRYSSLIWEILCTCLISLSLCCLRYQTIYIWFIKAGGGIKDKAMPENLLKKKRKETGEPACGFPLTHSCLSDYWGTFSNPTRFLGPQILSLLRPILLFFVLVLLPLFSSCFPSRIYGGEIWNVTAIYCTVPMVDYVCRSS